MPAGNPATSNPSIVQTAQHGDPAERAKAVEHIVIAHWKPLYKYVRAQYRLSHTEAWTITLNFLRLLDEGIFFAKFDGSKTSLREFIRGRLDMYMPTPVARRVTEPPTTIDLAGAEEEFLADQATPNESAIEYYNNEWVRNLLTLAVEELHNNLTSEGKSRDAELFMKLDLQDRSGDRRVTLEAIANELSMPMGEAWNSLAQTRQRFQSILIDLIRSFTSSDAEFRREIQTFIHS